MKWSNVKLKDCCSSIADGDHQPPPKADAGVPFVTISNINTFNTLDFENAMHVPREYYDGLDPKRRATTGDVLYSVVGSFGIPVLIKDDAPFVFQRHIAILRPDKTMLDSRFLYYTMRGKDFYHLADAAAIGAAQRTISLSALKNLEILLPPLPVQRRIADILSAYDDLIENNRKQIKLLEEAAQRLYKEWFIDLRFPGHEHTPIINGVPAGWKKTQMGCIANITMGQSPKSEFYNKSRQGLPFHQGVGSYGERFVVDDIYSSSFTKIAMPGDILFSVRAPVGRLNITLNKIVIGRGLSALRHKGNLQSFLFYMLKELFFKDDIVGNGSIFASVSKDELNNFTITVPIEGLGKTFDKKASAIDQSIEMLSQNICYLQEIRNRLLPVLMRGEPA